MINRAPKKIPIPGAEGKQFALFLLGAAFAFFACVAVAKDSPLGFVICGGICAVSWFSASKMKTHWAPVDQATRYRKR